MTRRLQKILSAGLAAGLAALAVPAQPALPFYFEANRGQADSPVQFLARERDSQFLISPTAAQIVLHKAGAGTATVRMQFVGANAQAQTGGEAALPGRVNYLVGTPAQWHADVPIFARVSVPEIYPGVNVVYYGNQQQLEYDLTVAPGADPQAIAIRFDGLEKISVSAGGGLVLSLPAGEIRQPKPVIYQMAGGTRREISGGYKILDARTVAFAVGGYDHSLPLVIDPILSYSTYFGGNNGETAWAVALDSSNNIYIAGQTLSTRFTNNAVPFSFSTPGAWQTNFAGGAQAGDAFIAKLDNAGSNLIYLTYLGGSGDDAAYGLAVDGAGHAFVAGATDSTNFPVKNAVGSGTNIGGPIDPHSGGLFPTDAFVTELETNGASLIYSTYLGGEGYDTAYAIAVDQAGQAYVTGFTYSTNFPTTTNALFTKLRCPNSYYINANAFVTEIASNGTKLVYSTYLGGTNFDQGKGIAVDAGGFVYVAGFTSSTNFPATNYIHQLINSNWVDGHALNALTNLYQSAYQNLNNDAFVAKFTPGCTNLVYSTLLGNTNLDMAFGITADGAGDAFVVGATASPFFPNTAAGTVANGLTNNYIYGYPVTTNVFLTEITNGATAGIAYSTLFGGSSIGNIDVGCKVALNSAGDAFVVGYSFSTNFPAVNTFGSLRATNSGGSDAFITVFNTNGTAVLYSGLLGGFANDYGYGLAVDAAGNAYVVGTTISTNFPTFNARQTALNGTSDSFLVKIAPLSPAPVLSAALAGTNVLVSWPPIGEENPAFLILESNTNLLTTNWISTAQTPVLTNGAYYFKFNPTNRQQFFRLHQF